MPAEPVAGQEEQEGLVEPSTDRSPGILPCHRNMLGCNHRRHNRRNRDAVHGDGDKRPLYRQTPVRLIQKQMPEQELDSSVTSFHKCGKTLLGKHAQRVSWLMQVECRNVDTANC